MKGGFFALQTKHVYINSGVQKEETHHNFF